MRTLPLPRRPDATPMPEGDSHDWLTHPGPVQQERFTLGPCHAQKRRLSLRGGLSLLDAVAEAVEGAGADGATVILDGLRFSAMDYVMPDGPLDEQHAAWYSETYRTGAARLDFGTASCGRKDGAWFMHSHAMWQAEAPGMGHLLNDQCFLDGDQEIEAYLLSGARLVVTHDSETNFSLFHPEVLRQVEGANAALLTIRPHEDLRPTIEAACAGMGFAEASIHGIGSLIGAGFRDGAPMAAPLSEVVLLAGCAVEGGQCRDLSMAMVDPAGTVFRGDLLPGKGPVCVTFELLLVAD